MPRSAEAQVYHRLYSTTRWLAIRAKHLRDEPLCRFCLARGIVAPATVCDHLDPHRGDEAKFYNGPFQSLCSSCHSSDKQRIENGNGPRPYIGEDGWPISA